MGLERQSHHMILQPQVSWWIMGQIHHQDTALDGDIYKKCQVEATISIKDTKIHIYYPKLEHGSKILSLKIQRINKQGQVTDKLRGFSQTSLWK